MQTTNHPGEQSRIPAPKQTNPLLTWGLRALFAAPGIYVSAYFFPIPAADAETAAMFDTIQVVFIDLAKLLGVTGLITTMYGLIAAAIHQ